MLDTNLPIMIIRVVILICLNGRVLRIHFRRERGMGDKDIEITLYRVCRNFLFQDGSDTLGTQIVFRLEDAVTQVTKGLSVPNLLQMLFAFSVTIELLWTTETVVAVNAVDLGHRRGVSLKRSWSVSARAAEKWMEKKIQIEYRRLRRRFQ